MSSEKINDRFLFVFSSVPIENSEYQNSNFVTNFDQSQENSSRKILQPFSRLFQTPRLNYMNADLSPLRRNEILQLKTPKFTPIFWKISIFNDRKTSILNEFDEVLENLSSKRNSIDRETNIFNEEFSCDDEKSVSYSDSLERATTEFRRQVQIIHDTDSSETNEVKPFLMKTSVTQKDVREQENSLSYGIDHLLREEPVSFC